ncbi:MAG: MmcQ/YjbR family DNA-binding protein [Calditrichaceae bacterium]|nr:MmcQ/YjbR family DNA-binding protein [Calditrichaceae bacterium]MBN2710761.1 MmcQ/YjbR family DNA-binding protein [Calditrichaceae bacterium]RQV95711.1 MAG: MmcQ/YjbR family DNA-binding protein [Calditrichota bacterium]
MTLQYFIDYCSGKAGVTKEFPFDDTTLVLKVKGKMFALIAMDEAVPRANLKCDPVYAIALRQKYQSVRAGYHMNKRHWNTVELEGDVPDTELKEMIDDSYNLVVKGLPVRLKEQLNKTED